MLKFISRFLVVLVFLPLLAFATNNSAFQAGKNYQVINSITGLDQPVSNKIQVIEFFSFGCPACYHFEPYLEKWLSNKSKDVDFVRIPVTFEPGWDVLARAYYTAQNLGVADKLAPAIFNAIWEQKQDLTNEDNLAKFFAEHGIKQKDFESAFNFSPGIDAQIMNANNLMRSYGVYQIPTMVINGKYKTNIAMTNGDANKVFQIIDYLVTQERQSVK